MQNVHLDTAARNLQRAIADAQLKQQQIRAEADNTIRQHKDAISEMRTEEGRLRTSISQSEQDADKMVMAGRIRFLQIDIAKAEKEIRSIDERATTEAALFARQVVDITEIMNRLTTMS